MPALGLSVLPEDAARALVTADLVKRAGPKHLNCRLDLRSGDWEKPIVQYRELLQRVGAAAVVEVILRGDAAPEAELRPVADALSRTGLKPTALVVTPAADLQSYPPGIPFPENVPSWTEIAAAARKLFPGVRLGGGMLSNFTEINRKRPPKGLFDFVTHATSALVHAADDRSVMETLESVGHIIRATKSMTGGAPYRIGPSHIGNSFNPYGAAYTENPENRRVTMARVDPRHRGLFGAAWHLGYISQAAEGGLEAVTMASPVGEFGIAYASLGHTQLWFDSAPEAKVYPLFHVIRGLAAASGKPRLAVQSGDTERLRAVAWRAGGETHLWLANLHDVELEVKLERCAPKGRITVLDERSFEAAASDPAFGDKTGAFAGDTLKLGPLATAGLVFET
jgi:hypothetical protein